MKCTLNIYNDDGDTLLERELTHEQALAVLITLPNQTPTVPEPEKEVDEPVTIQSPKTKGKKGKNKCSICGVRGHTSRSCKASSQKESASPSKQESAPNAEPMTEDQFDFLKHLQKIGDLSSKDFAANEGLALSEVNRAITCRNYHEYRNF